MRPHENLELWKKAIEFVVSVYRVTDRFPKEEKFGLTSQLRRASVSIVANILKGLRDDRLRSSGSSFHFHKVRQAKLMQN